MGYAPTLQAAAEGTLLITAIDGEIGLKPEEVDKDCYKLVYVDYRTPFYVDKKGRHYLKGRDGQKCYFVDDDVNPMFCEIADDTIFVELLRLQLRPVVVPKCAKFFAGIEDYEWVYDDELEEEIEVVKFRKFTPEDNDYIEEQILFLKGAGNRVVTFQTNDDLFSFYYSDGARYGPVQLPPTMPSGTKLPKLMAFLREWAQIPDDGYLPPVYGSSLQEGEQAPA